MGRPKKDQSKKLVNFTVRVTEDDLAYIDTHFESRSTAFRIWVRERRLREYNEQDNMETIYQAYQEVFIEPLLFAANNGRNIDHIVPTFAGLYEKRYGLRPSDEKVRAHLNSKMMSMLQT